MKSNKPSLMRLLAAAAAAVLCIAGLYAVGRWLERRDQLPETRGDLKQRYAEQPTVEIGGVRYRAKSGLTTILLMGIDRASSAAATGYRNGGQADFLQLLVADASANKITLLPIDRDTMTPITILSVLGKKAGMRTAQIALSHGFGDGGAQSCELTAEAVSDLLLGIEIDDYIAVNLDGIAAVNDLVGGVTVTLEDDFSAQDPAMTAGTTLTLRGMQAEYYVRGRMSIGVGTNEARMARQKTYLSGLGEKLRALSESESGVAALYDGMQPYMQSSMNRGLLINRVWAMRHDAADTVELPGTHSVGTDGFMEFHPDGNALQETVLRLFYEPTK